MRDPFSDVNLTLRQSDVHSDTCTLKSMLQYLQTNSILLMVTLPARGNEILLTESILQEALQLALYAPAPTEIFQLDTSTWMIACRLLGEPDHNDVALYVHSICRRLEQELLLSLGRQSSTLPAISIIPIAPLHKNGAVEENLLQLNGLLDVIVNNRLNTQFQPIVSLTTGKVMGYEALIRGEENSPLRRPGEMLHVAGKAHMIAWFDMACLEECFKRAAEQRLKHSLFVNVEAEGLDAIQQHDRTLAERVATYGLHPEQIVIEITERQTLNDFPRLIQGIKQLRSQGFRFAVDDAGAGYNSLEIIVELRPDYVKVARKLVAGIDVHGARRGLLASLVRYARQIGTSVIGEGVETRAELETLIDLGVQHVQGYLLGRPNFNISGISRENRALITDRQQFKQQVSVGRDRPVSSLMRPGGTLPTDGMTKQAVKILERDPGLTSIVVVNEQGEPSGILMREQLLGLSLEMRESSFVSAVMQRNIITVNSDTLITELPQIVSRRSSVSLDTDIVVVGDDGENLGVIAVRLLLEALCTMQRSSQRYSDSLTGLPNRVVLEQSLRERLDSRQPVGIVRIDVMYLESFNRIFGNSHGDEMIKGVVALLLELREEIGSDEDIVTHMGGDDFIVLTHPDSVKSYCDHLEMGFIKIRNSIYPPATIRNGYMELEEGHGRRRVPLCTLALAALSGKQGGMNNAVQTLEVLHRLLRAVQEKFGGGCAIDRLPTIRAA